MELKFEQTEKFKSIFRFAAVRYWISVENNGTVITLEHPKVQKHLGDRIICIPFHRIILLTLV